VNIHFCTTYLFGTTFKYDCTYNDNYSEQKGRFDAHSVPRLWSLYIGFMSPKVLADWLLTCSWLQAVDGSPAPRQSGGQVRTAWVRLRGRHQLPADVRRALGWRTCTGGSSTGAPADAVRCAVRRHNQLPRRVYWTQAWRRSGIHSATRSAGWGRGDSWCRVGVALTIIRFWYDSILGCTHCRWSMPQSFISFRKALRRRR